MKNFLSLLALLLCMTVAAHAQYISAQSHKQATATTQTITSDAAGTAVDVTGYSQVLLAVRGTYVVVTITFEASPDGTNYFPLACTRVDSSVTETASGALTNTTRAWRCTVTGFTKFRTGSGTDWTSGTVNVSITPVAASADLGVTVGQATAANLNATVTGTVATTPPSNASSNVAQINGVTPLMGAGNTGTGSPRVTVASDQAAIPASQSGTWTVQPGNTANTTAWKVDGSAVTQPVSGSLTNISGTISLPTGAATAAKQPALGTAGTASADVLTVQGIASMTALKVDGSAVTQPVSAASLPLPSGASTAANQTTGNTSLSSIDTNTTNVPNVIGTAASAVPSKLLQVGGSDGTNARALKTNTSGQLDVRPLTSSDQITTVPSGTQTVSGTVTANAGSGSFTVAQSTASSLKVEPAGNVASGATDSGNPLKVGAVFNTTQPTVTTGQRVDAQATARGAHIVATGADTFNVTVNTALPTGSNTIGAVNLAQYTAVSGRLPVDGSGVTQPVSGTVTANIGTVGSLALDASVTGLQVTQGSTTSGQKGGLGLGAVTTAAPSYTTAQSSPLSLTTAGALRVDNSANTQPVSGTVSITSNSAVNVAQVNGVAPTMGNGVSGTGVQRVTLASDSTGQVALAAGSNTIGALTANQSVNHTQLNGTTVDTNSGNKSAGTQRVVLATDQPALTNSLNVTQKAATSTSGTLQSAVTANGNGTVLSVDGMSSAVLTVNCSSCSGGTTVNFEATEDGTNYAAVSAVQVGTTTIATTTTTSGVTIWEMPTGGFVSIRARVSAYSAGTITVTGHTVPVSYNPKVVNANVVANTASNQSTNVAQINGVAPTMGNGVSGTGVQRVTLASDSTGTVAVTQATAANLNAQVVGAVASGATDAGNPLKTGGAASSSFPTAVTTGQRVNEFYDLNGRAVTSPYANPENLVSGVTAAITGTSDTSIIAAQGAGVRTYVTSLSIINSHASVDTVVELKDNTTVIWRGFAKSGGGGFTITFPAPLRGSANVALNCAAVTTGANVYCSAAGFKAP